MLVKQNLNIGLTEEDREQIVNILNTVLADEHLLYTKLRNYHWNVTGIHFRTLHEMFEEQYTAITVIADEIAEQARALGGHATGTMKEFLEQSRLEENTSTGLSAEQMVLDLAKSHETMVRNLREDISRTMDEFADEGSADILIATLNQHSQMAWMLRSMLESEPQSAVNGISRN